MPLYEYRCDGCGHQFEVIQKFSDPPLETCPQCSGSLHKLQSAPAFQFKGTGWYITDYAKKEQPSAKGDAGEGAKAGEGDGAKASAEAGEKAAAADSSRKETTEKSTEKSKASASDKAKAGDSSKSQGSNP